MTRAASGRKRSDDTSILASGSGFAKAMCLKRIGNGKAVLYEFRGGTILSTAIPRLL